MRARERAIKEYNVAIRVRRLIPSKMFQSDGGIMSSIL